MAKIFISYRRADSETIVGRIYDRLIGRFGAEAIFKDVDNIPLGLDFKQYVAGVIRQCAVQLVIIGPRWLDITDAHTGRRRLDDPKDNVRVEIEAAIEANILIIPLLVERATMPEIERLPASLHPLASRNGRPVRNDPDFNHDIERVLAALEQYLHGTAASSGAALGTATTGTGAHEGADPQAALVRQMLPEIERAYAAGDWMGVSDRAAYLARHAPNALPESAYRMWGAALYEEGDLAGARRAFDGALGLDASGKPMRLFTVADLPALLSAAELRTRAGEPAAAEPLLADALALPGTDAATQLSVLREYMNVLIALGRWDDMLRRATQAQRLAPDDINVLRARLDALMHLNRTAEAADQARQIAARSDARVSDWIALACLTASATHNNRNEVRAVLDDAARRFPDDASLAQARRELLPPPVPRERFPERLERLGLAAEMSTDPTTGKEVAFIRPPLCPVPAGPFLMGSDPKQDSQASDAEKPQITVELPAYQIGTFPVTVAEYACFVAAGHPQPRKGYLGTDWQTQLARLDRPVTCVSWKDAWDYAAWLHRLTGQAWALPSEAEWEKAARWDARGNGGRGHARIYPWGDRFEASRCNTSESGISTTTPVGTYGPEDPDTASPVGARHASPAAHDGSSPYGAQDLAGNVWEWTRTIWDAQGYRTKTFRDDDSSTESRVLRGGSWNDDSGGARAAYRGIDRPGNTYGGLGFRVALPSEAPSSF